MDSELLPIVFNGTSCDVPVGTTINALLDRAQIRTRLVAVEINGEIVPHEDFPDYVIRPGDQVEVVTLVGGG